MCIRDSIELIGAAWGLGGAEPNCAEAPEVLAPLLTEALQRCGARLDAGPMLRPAAGERGAGPPGVGLDRCSYGRAHATHQPYGPAPRHAARVAARPGRRPPLRPRHRRAR